MHLQTYAALAIGAATMMGCVSDEHPLATGGIATFLFDNSVIFAADVLDDEGNPVLPRQQPFEKVVRMQLLVAGEADQGAYVDVQLDPPGVLRFVPTSDGSCRQMPGAFRCTAQEDGFATFIVRSESDWSGTAEIGLIGRPERDEIVVHPAGLPEQAFNFTMVIEGVDSFQVPARYNALGCTIEPEPDNAFNKWPAGAVRVREAEVRASPPANAPSVIEHAPVIIETLDSEVFVTLDPECNPPRDSRLRVQLDALGRSPKFYFCFSDIGGDNMLLAFNSGVKIGTPASISVEPEPRLLRIVTQEFDVMAGMGPIEVVSVSAFDADLNKTPLTIDVRSTDPNVLQVQQATAVLPREGEEARLLFAEPRAAGTARIQISPELFSMPLCESETITVTGP